MVRTNPDFTKTQETNTSPNDETRTNPSSRNHTWVHWRPLYVTNPEGNQVELVCYDSSV